MGLRREGGFGLRGTVMVSRDHLYFCMLLVVASGGPGGSWDCGLADGARWVLSAIAQSRPQPPLVPIFQCGFRTPEGGGGGLRPHIDSGDSPALCAISC